MWENFNLNDIERSKYFALVNFSIFYSEKVNNGEEDPRVLVALLLQNFQITPWLER